MKVLFENNHLLFAMQFGIALIVIGVWAYLLATGHTVPEQLSNVVTLVLGFFFGSQVTEMVTKSK